MPMRGGRTSIRFAHRVSTVRSLDRILVFACGEIVEEGNRAALVARVEGNGVQEIDRKRQAVLR
jgi:autotransporter passenger strand-loop-strand repeat protein